jgi:hypothetical protein
MVYTGEWPPAKLLGEEKMNKDPIKMEPINGTERIDAKSRVNLGKLHVIEHNVKIMPVGMIAQSDIRRLKAYCNGYK